MTGYTNLKSFAFFAIFFLLSCMAIAQDKSFLKCDGKATVIASDEINITGKEVKNAYKVKPMSLRVVIDGARISVNGDEFKKIETTFPDDSTLQTFEHGNLQIKDTYYDGYRILERDKKFKDSSDPFEKQLYFYKNTRFVLDRLDGEFTWTLTYYGTGTWINDLLPNKVKDKYLNLEVGGLCKRDVQKVLF
jgi:hypothetical protein